MHMQMSIMMKMMNKSISSNIFPLGLLLHLMRLGDQPFFFLDSPHSSDVEGHNQHHNKEQEDHRPHLREPFQSLGHDPVHEAKHHPKYASDC